MIQMKRDDIYHLIQGSLDGIIEPTTLSLEYKDSFTKINYEFSCNSLKIYLLHTEDKPNPKFLLSEQIYDILYDEDIKLIDNKHFTLYITHKPMFFDELVEVYDAKEGE